MRLILNRTFLQELCGKHTYRLECDHSATHARTHAYTCTLSSCPLPFPLLQNTGGGAEGSGQRLESTGSCLPIFSTLPFVECNVKGCHFYSSDISFWLANLEDLMMMERINDPSMAEQGASRYSVCKKVYT